MKKVVRGIICAVLVSAMLLVIASGVVLAAQTKGITNSKYLCNSNVIFGIVGERQESINKSKVTVSVHMIADNVFAGYMTIELWITHFDANGNSVEYHRQKSGSYFSPYHAVTLTGKTTNLADGYAVIQIWTTEWCGGYWWNYKVYFKPESQGGVTISLLSYGYSEYPPEWPY